MDRLEPGGGRRHPLAGPMAAAAVSLLLAAAASLRTGVALRDVKGAAAGRFGVTVALATVVAVLDALRRGRGVRRGVVELRRRWHPRRAATVVAAIAAFYAAYLAYRNVKSLTPLLRPHVLFDRQLLATDRALLGSGGPPARLHELLGTHLAAQLLSPVYLLFFLYIPLVVVCALVLLDGLRDGLFATTALACTWPLGALTYVALPSLGPVYDEPGRFAGLPATAVSRLQERLLTERAAFLDHPGTAAGQGIGAFASLHVAVFVATALLARALGLPGAVQAVCWSLTLATVMATVYFGWHYAVDDVAGALIAVASVALGRRLTGWTGR